ncbi:alpha/beta fold hydrolase [Pseudactinotalea sp.]|uniref:alpha/beta fold hydrolase n=1 Tax=Pseudactinotalea sp. TaxID=1926260 RepID=UPI003B3B5C91
MSHKAGGRVAPLHVDTIAGRTSRTVLLLHGGGVGGWMWQPLIERLGHERTYLVPDLPGHDHSANQDYRSHRDTVDALVRVIESQAGGSVSVVGFSLGAQLAVLLAAERPDLVDRVTVISAQAKPTRFPAATLAMLGLAAPLAKNERFARAQAKELFIPADLFSDYLRVSRSLSTATLIASVGENISFTIPPAWASFPGSALMLVGAEERQMMKTSADSLAQVHARGAAEVVDGCGHGIPLQEPAWLAERLRRWLPSSH